MTWKKGLHRRHYAYRNNRRASKGRPHRQEFLPDSTEKVAPNACLVTLAPEYSWSEVEPAMAIISACVVTYRPLFDIFNVNFSKVWSTFSRKSSRRSDLSNEQDVFGETSYLQWPSSTRDARLESLNIKSARDGLHVVQIDLGTAPGRKPGHKERKQSLC